MPELFSAFETEDIRLRAVPVWHLEDLHREIARLLRGRMIDRQVAERYVSSFRYTYEKRFPQARSVIVAAAPCRAAELRFTFRGKSCRAIVPPTYIEPPVPVESVIRERVKAAGFSALTMQEAGCRLPLKLLAVRSGLARYGRNNLTFTQEWGSFINLTAMFSDYPADGAEWVEDGRMPECEECDACLRSCPNGCITHERRTIHADRCVTFFNEDPGDFPEWIGRPAHNSLIGCMRCQNACPCNRDKLQTAVYEDAFDNEELDMVLKGRDFGLLPTRIQRLIQDISMEDCYKNGVMTRNLKALLRLLP